MYIKQIYKAKTDWWRYMIGIFIIFLFWQVIGGIPLLGAIFLETGPDFLSLTMAEMMQVLDSNLTFFLMLLSFVAGLGALLFVIKIIHQQSIKEATTSRKKIDWGRFFFGFGLISTFTIVGVLIDYNMNPDDYLWNFDPVPFTILVLIAVVMVPLQTSFEEYLFRGYLMQGLGALAHNRWFPLIITSVVFGGMHILNPEVEKLGYIIMVYYIGTGFLFGIITLMDEGMELALGLHAGNNLIGAMLVTADWTAFQTNSILKDVSDPSAGWDVVLPILIIYPLFLFIMAKKYNWSNWGEKLFGKVKRPETINYSEEI
ncbi:lysostaphin resistance A-like protein [Salinimicrobium sp. GXAS 041]|uniref:CPBP family intramembrane glutamic endopeptidase n=1 Tax=Salinimicrobium sp. GXAS 041 TaxID=3400806 RepID=UPI003C763CE6